MYHAGWVDFNKNGRKGVFEEPSRTVQAAGPEGLWSFARRGGLYPFGFGLSYTKFTNSDLKIVPAETTTNGEVAVTFEIKNVGDCAGDEVAQLYFHQETSSVTTYEKNLCGFERVALKPGETKSVTFKLPAAALELINRQNQRVVEPGTFKVMVGSSSEDIRLAGEFTVKANAEHQ